MRTGVFLFCLLTASTGLAAEFWVSPDARRGGSGTHESPFTLEEALAQPRAVKPGDTIWLLGGVYRGTFTSTLAGTPSAPIVVRAVKGERATLDGGRSNGKAVLTIAGRYTWYRGFEVTSSDPKRQSNEDVSWPSDIPRGEGVLFAQTPGSGVGVKLIDLVIHDTRQGISFWADAEDAEAYGCLIYDNGWDGLRGRGHGHGIYVQNKGGKKRIENNVIFHNFGGGIVAYGSEKAFLDNLELVGNTVFESGSPSRHGVDRNILLGGGVRARNARIESNATWYRSGSANNLGYDAGCEGAVVKENVFVNAGGGPSFTIADCRNVELANNTFLGDVKGMAPPRGNKVLARPSGVTVMVRRDKYEKGRAVLTVFNWDKSPVVRFDPGDLLEKGASFEVRNAQDWFGPPVLSGRYDGGPLRLRMVGLKTAAPVGWTAPPATGPDFNVFILLADEPQPQPVTLAATAARR